MTSAPVLLQPAIHDTFGGAARTRTMDRAAPSRNATSHLTTKTGLQVAISSARPTWQAGVSICNSLPDFEAVDQYPIRSPLAVADYLAPRVAGLAFTEIGTRNGDVMACLSHFAGHVTAIELDPIYCAKLRARGFHVICEAVERIPPSRMPKTDVYFWWPMSANLQNEVWLRQLLAAHRSSGRQAVAYVAHDSHFPVDMQMLPQLVQHYGGSIERVCAGVR